MVTYQSSVKHFELMSYYSLIYREGVSTSIVKPVRRKFSGVIFCNPNFLAFSGFSQLLSNLSNNVLLAIDRRSIFEHVDFACLVEDANVNLIIRDFMLKQIS